MSAGKRGREGRKEGRKRRELKGEGEGREVREAERRKEKDRKGQGMGKRTKRKRHPGYPSTDQFSAIEGRKRQGLSGRAQGKGQKKGTGRQRWARKKRKTADWFDGSACSVLMLLLILMLFLV